MSHELPVPSMSPNPKKLVLTNVNGDWISLDKFQDPPTYLTFFSADCTSCQRLVERFRWWPNATHDTHDVQPVFVGDPDDFRQYEEFEPLVEHALYDRDGSVARAVGYQGTPGTVAIDEEHPLGYGWIPGAKLSELYVVRPGFYEEIAKELGISEPEEDEVTDAPAD